MSMFVWVMATLLAVEALAEMICLAKGNFPARTASNTAAHVVVNIVLIVWCAVLLSGAAT